MVYSIRSLGLHGVSGYPVTAECDLSGGLPAFTVVGLPDAAVNEARERVRSAIKNCGFTFPVSRITVNLAPAHLKKAGTLYDLPMLVGILAAGGQLKLPPAALCLCRGAVPVRTGAPLRRHAPHGPVCRAGGDRGPLCSRGQCRRGNPGPGAGDLPCPGCGAAGPPPVRRGADCSGSGLDSGTPARPLP